MKSIGELIKACEHLLVFLHANGEEELVQVEQEQIEELVVQVEELCAEPVVEVSEEEIVIEDEPVVAEVLAEPKPVTDLDFLKDTAISFEKPFKPTKEMNYKELREYYKRLRGE